MIHYVVWGIVAACVFMWGAIFGQWHTQRGARKRCVPVKEQPLICIACGQFDPLPGRTHVRERDLKCMTPSVLVSETATNEGAKR